jgi:hypothetical protein
MSGAARDPRSYLLSLYPKAAIAPLDRVALTAAPLVARVNQGVWIASCSCGMPGIPRPGCVVFLDHLLGWCVRCGNQAWGGGWRTIAAPPEAERRLIEAVLACRPDLETRNWEPGESVADLIAENIAHGVPIPTDDEPPASAPVPVPPQAPWPSDAARAVIRAHDPHRRGRR